MPRRRRPCDVPGCPHERAESWHRVCPAHFTTIARGTRDALERAYRHNRTEWRRLRRTLRADADTAARQPETDSRAAYARIAAMLGEHD